MPKKISKRTGDQHGAQVLRKKEIIKTDILNCSNAEGLFAFYLAGRTTDEETKLLRTHLRSCPTCREALARETRLTRVMRNALVPRSEPESMEFMWARVQAKLIERRSAKPKVWWRWIFAGAGAGLASAAALVAFIFLRTPIAPALALHEASYFKGMPAEPPAMVSDDAEAALSTELVSLSLGSPTPSARSASYANINGGGN